MQARGLVLRANGEEIVTQPRVAASAADLGPQDYVVITLKAGTWSLSAVTESCRLHDEQLPQSPRPETTASQPLISATIWASAGAL